MSESVPVNGINTYNEKSLHAALKQWYARPGDQIEIRVDGYIIDLVRGDLLVEFQTGSFNALKRKLAVLTENHPVRLVFPIPLEKWIILRQEGSQPGERRRKSPKRGRMEDVFTQLVYIPSLILRDNFTLEVLLTREEEVRRAVEKKHRRHKGWVLEDRRLLAVTEQRVFNNARELACLLPNNLDDPFTVRDLAKAARQPVWLAQKMVYCLRQMGAIHADGKRGRANLYLRSPAEPANLRDACAALPPV